jgi:heme-degrading monooxygenase HmoA
MRRDLDHKGQVVVIIRTTPHADVDMAMYEALNARMYAIASDMPGFVSARSYKSDDGDELSLIRFTSAAALHAWRMHPEHVVVQQRGMTEIYRAYDVEVLEVTRAYDFTRA